MNILGYLFTIGEFLPAMKVFFFFPHHFLSFFFFPHHFLFFFLLLRIADQGTLWIYPATVKELPSQVCNSIILFQNVVGQCIQTNFVNTCTQTKYSDKCTQILKDLKQRGSKCLDKCSNINKVSPSTREPSSSGREHLTHSGRNWQELGWVQRQVFLAFGKFCLFQVRITNILPGFVWTEGVDSEIYNIHMWMCLWSMCLIVCACLWP